MHQSRGRLPTIQHSTDSTLQWREIRTSLATWMPRHVSPSLQAQQEDRPGHDKIDCVTLWHMFLEDVFKNIPVGSLLAHVLVHFVRLHAARNTFYRRKRVAETRSPFLKNATLPGFLS